MGTQWLLALLLFISSLVGAAPGEAIMVSQLDITGGTFTLNEGFGSNALSGSFTQPGTLVMGQYQAPPTLLGPFTIANHAISLFTHPGIGETPLPTPTGQVSGNTISVDLRSLFAAILPPPVPQGGPFPSPFVSGAFLVGNQLPALATGTFDQATNAFTLSWMHLYPGIPGVIGQQFGYANIVLQGTVALIPLPASLLLFATGLAVLVWTRRRRGGTGELQAAAAR